MLFRKRIQSSVISILAQNTYFTPPPLSNDRLTKVINAAFRLRVSYAETIKDRESAMWYIDYKYFGQFSTAEKEVIYQYIQTYDFDRLVSLLKSKLSKFYWYLLGHLDSEDLGQPIVPTWFKPNLKFYWLKVWLFFPIRNPLDLKLYLDTDFYRTSNLYNKQIIIGIDNTIGETHIDGIGTQKIGEQFFYTSDQKYFSYKYTAPDLKRFFSFGYGGLQPNLYTSRATIGIATREMINEIKYYE